jgi:arylsulfatase A-like enzyme
MEKLYRRFLSEHKNDKTPYFACFGVWEAHRPFKGWGDPIDPTKVKIPPYLPDLQIVREDLAEYYGAIQVVDKTIGVILDTLEDSRLADNTLFIYTTDHGEPYPRAKCTLYDPGIKTSLLMLLPNSDIFSGGKVSNQMISNVDLLPILIDLVGGEIPKGIMGKSFKPYLADLNFQFREEIYTEKTFHDVYDPIRSIRTNEYKYIFNFEKIDTLYRINDFLARDPLGEYMKKVINISRSEEELYNLKKDPTELNNLAYDPGYLDVRSELKDNLFNWMKKTEDPILKGKIKDLREEPPTHY